MICASCGAEADAAANECPKCRGATLLADRYRLLSILGRGANGITYRAERTTDGRLFAVKEMPVRTLENVKAMELFDREARVLRELDHPGIPRYEDDFVFGEGKNAGLYLVQELVVGQTLADEMASRRDDVAAVFAIVSELAGVLDYLHRRSPPVVHRDVKPKNVMRRDDGRLVLIDFGSVRDAVGSAGGSTVAGTFGYMAPEQLAGKATPASDVYGLGALAVALLTRKEPDQLIGDDNRIDVRAHLDAPEDALLLLEAMLETSPSRRLQRASEVAARARDIGAGATRARAASDGPSGKQRGSEEAEARAARQASVREVERARRADEQRERDRAAKGSAPAGPVGATNPQASSRRKRWGVWIGVAVMLLGVPVAVVAAMSYPGSVRATESVPAERGMPELYARPLVTDVDGDGVEDMIVVTAVDRAPRSSYGDEDAWGNEHGRFDAFVQAIDGKDGTVLYSLAQGQAYTAPDAAAKSSPRIVLVAGKGRLGVARIPTGEEASITIHELATGKELASLSFDPSSGRACELVSGAARFPNRFLFDRSGTGTSGTVIDLERATAKASSSSCGDYSTPSVADVPSGSITDRTVWETRFSPEIELRKGAGPYGGNMIVVATSGVGFLVTGEKRAEQLSVEENVTVDAGGALRPTRDNTKIDVVGLDVAAGTTRFVRSLASLGFTTQVVDHVEVIDRGALLFFEGTGGLALVDAERGDRVWSLPLPKGQRLSSYTLSKTRAYLHVFGPAPSTTYSFLSKTLGSRILVVDLATGSYVRSVPDGPLAPDLTPPRATVDPASFVRIAGCSCLAARSAPAQPLDWGSMTIKERWSAMEALKAASDSGARSGNARARGEDAGASAQVDLGMFMRSSVEPGGRKQFSVAYSLDVDGERFVLPHYDGPRSAIAPPPSIEGSVALGLACRGDAVVIASDRSVTAWSIAKKDELWTVELATPRAAAKTALGGPASLSCSLGRIDGDRVHIPGGSGAKEIVLSLADGAVVGSADAGTSKSSNER